MKYPMNSKKEMPLFNYMVMVNGEFDYYLYEDFDDAVSKAKQLGKDLQIALIYEPYFCTSTREWRVQCAFKVMEGKIYYDKHAEIQLHLAFYINAGNWLNPKPEWIETK